MRRFHFTLLGVLSVFLLSLLCPSCRPQSDVEEATLELSATALTLPREGTAQTLTITTNQSSWSAFSPQEDTILVGLWPRRPPAMQYGPRSQRQPITSLALWGSNSLGEK